MAYDVLGNGKYLGMKLNFSTCDCVLIPKGRGCCQHMLGSPQAQTRLVDAVWIYVKSLLKLIKTNNLQHQKEPCLNATQLQNTVIDDTACQDITYPNHA